MSSPTPPIRAETVLYEWVRLLFGSLARLGLRDVVLCPGSRNAPLILAALDEPLLRCHSVIDERSAGFFALGLGRAQGRPVALVCTSGSALAHFVPAVVEAHLSEVPLIVLSADRPSYLQDCGAAQTMDQHRFFGGFARTIAGWDEPSPDPKRMQQWLRKIGQLWARSHGPHAGPVHLNIPLDKPLEPLPPVLGDEGKLHDRVTFLLNELSSVEAASTRLNEDLVIRFLDRFTQEKGSGLMVIGPVEPEVARKAQDLATVMGLPVLTEIPGLDGKTRSVERLARTIEQGTESLKVFHVGPPLTSSAWGRLLNTEDVPQYIVCGARYQDPSARAKEVIAHDLAASLEQMRVSATTRGRFGNAARFLDPSLSEADRDLLGVAIKAGNSQDGLLNEPAAVLEVLNSAETAGTIFLGNSLSVRLAAWVGPLLPQRRWSVRLTRGANGIDGHIAQAAGLARASGEPVVALIGDVAAAHDIGSLQVARDLGTALLIVVLDNQGGRIFDHLPGAQLWPERPLVPIFFLTPPQLDWVSLGQGFGIETSICTTLTELGNTVTRALAQSVTHLVVARTDPETTRSFLRTLQEGETQS